MHQMGFRIVDRLQEMTRKQKLFFQLMSIEINKKDDGKSKAKEIVDRSRDGKYN